MELSRKLCWVVRDPSETQRGSDKGSHRDDYLAPPEIWLMCKGGWWEIRGTGGGVCCPWSTRKGVGVPIRGSDSLLWQVSVDTGQGVGAFSESHLGEGFLDSCSLLHFNARQFKVQYPFIDNICKCLFLWGV